MTMDKFDIGGGMGGGAKSDTGGGGVERVLGGGLGVMVHKSLKSEV